MQPEQVEASNAEPEAQPEPEPTSPSTTHAQPTPLFPAILMSRRHRRPTNPSRAPGVMISPLARPPPELLEQVGFWDEESEEEADAEPPAVVVADEVVALVEKEPQRVQTPPAQPPAVPIVLSLSTSPPLSTTDDWDVAPPSGSSAPGSAIASPIMSPARIATPTTVAATATATATLSPSLAPVAIPAVPSPAPAPPAQKKSWASLFSGSAPGQGQGQKLPTSSVVGISVPAESALAASSASAATSTSTAASAAGTGTSTPNNEAAGVATPPAGTNTSTTNDANALPPATKAALLALLSGEPSSTPASASSSTTTAGPTSPTALKTTFRPPPPQPALPSHRIIPRGLINTGNMCFANAVLQVLLCTRAFAGLFDRLGALVGPFGMDEEEAFPVMGGGVSANGPGSAKEKEKAKGVLAPAPLVRATAAFLKEFQVARPAASGTPAKQNGVGRGAGGGTAKGKGRADLSAEEEQEDGEAFIPTMVYDAIKGKKRFDGMRGGHQEDAEEFLGFFLDTLEEELVAVASALRDPSSSSSPGKPVVEEKEEKEEPVEDGWLEVGPAGGGRKSQRGVVTRTIESTDSPITRIFGGKFRSTLRAPGQRDSVIVEDWRALRLDIQRDGIRTVEDALGIISHASTIQITPTASAGAAAPAPIDASQQVLIEALPPVLVLHLKRFCYDIEVGGVVKVGKQIAFGPELEVPLEVMSAGLRKTVAAAKRPASKPGGGARYKLFGVIYHHGLSASGGHYTLDVLHPGRAPAASASVAQATATTTAGGGGATSSYAGAAAAATGPPINEGSWVRIDDELVSDVRPVDVFSFGSASGSGTAGVGAWPTVGANGKPNTGAGGRKGPGEVLPPPLPVMEESDNARCAYLLFYRRVG
ncbi:USP domain-containing protein [Mycena chlorophos]|uniref:Ubiquitin carboxyl-terminal hydrolase n=1 Tax=Mycena chlorophos TaxID=658473 RepID=A0A8H6SUS8_MYCCL|nr:USP domain-containing protein [Mycena chlorophos]